MSVTWGTQYAKLKTNLRLAANRLKLLQKKKTEMAMKARGEIADFLINDKEDRARIRVESIIREDFIVEAYELLEMFCELLLARFGLIQQMKEMDDGIAEAVASLLWIAPRISHEIVEFKVISAQLEHKYGKQYAETARMNQLPEPSRVAPKLVQKMSVTAPSKLLVEKYLIAIAKCANVDFKPDAKVMRDDDDEIALAEKNLINFMKDDQVGWNVPGAPGQSQQPPPPPPNYGPPRPPSNPGGGGGGTAEFTYPQVNHPPPANFAPPPSNFAQPPSMPPAYPTPPAQAPPAQPPLGFIGGHDEFDPADIPPPPPQLNSHNPMAPTQHNQSHARQAPAKSNEQTIEHIYEVPADGKDFNFAFPEPPTDFDDYAAVGGSSGSGGGGGGSGGGKKDELNFEELTERFKRLTKK